MRQTFVQSRRGALVGIITMLTCTFGMQPLRAAVTDVQINALISQAINTHPLVQSARAERDATTEGVTAAKLNLLPQPNVSMGYDKDDDFVSQLSIRQSLWTAGKLTANVNQAIFDDKAAIEFVYEQQNQVAKTTIDAWQSYIAAVGKQRVKADSLNKLNEFEAMMQRRVGQGVSARIELDLVTNRILQEQNAYQAAAEQQRIAAARLEQIVGEPISKGSSLTVPDLALLVRQIKQQSVEFEKLAFNQASFYNPTVVREAYQVESAKQELEAQESSRYPSIYAQYEHRYYRDKTNNDGRFSLGLDYAPGAGFSNIALARASEARVNSLKESQEAARRAVMEEIQVKYQQFASAKDRELSLVAAAAGAQIVVNSYRRQFIAGRKSWLEVLNAVRELSDYQVQLVETRSDILGAFYRLQVDFGLMPWQQFINNRKPVELFSPYTSVQGWLQKNQQKVKYNDNPLINSNNIINESLPLSFNSNQPIDYNKPDLINYNVSENLSDVDIPKEDIVQVMQAYAEEQRDKRLPQSVIETSSPTVLVAANDMPVNTNMIDVVAISTPAPVIVLPTPPINNSISNNSTSTKSVSTKLEPVNKDAKTIQSKPAGKRLNKNLAFFDGEKQRQRLLEQGQIMQKKMAKNKLIQQRLYNEKLAQEKLAQEKLAQEKLAQEKLAQEKLAQEKLAQEKLAQEKLAQEKLAQEKLAQEKLAQEKLAQEKLAQEKLAQEKLAQEKLAQEKLSQEKLAQEQSKTANAMATDVDETKSDKKSTAILPYASFSMYQISDESYK